MALDTNVARFIKQSEQTVTSKLAGSIQGKLLGLESSSGIAGVITKIAGETGLTDSVFSLIDSAVSGTDSLVTSKFDALFKKKSTTVSNNVANTSANTTSSSTIAKYPLDIGSYFTSLQFMEYHRPNPLDPPKMVNTQAIYLPLPQQLTDQHQVDYTSDSLGLTGNIVDSLQSASASGASAAGVAGGRAGIKYAGGAGERQAAAMAKMFPDAGIKPGIGSKLLKFSAASALSNEVGAATSQFTGASLNPNLSVTFKGPSLRAFSLSWQFAPHNKQESAAIKEIIRLLKQHGLPTMTYSGETSLLSYPDICLIAVKPNIIPYKKAMITNIAVDYAGAGIPTFFEGTDDYPAYISLQIDLQEIEYFLSEDFGGTSHNGLNADVGDVAAKLGSSVKDSLSEATSSIASFFTSSTNPQGG